MDIVQKITQAIEPSLTAMGYGLVQVKLTDGLKRRTLMVMAERVDEVPMSFDDCTEISRTVSALLDVEDPITTAYNLEVCSPGSDRPLTKLADYTRFLGYEVKLETLFPIEGRKRFRGVIEAVKNEVITLVMPEGRVEMSYPQVRTAKLAPEAPAASKAKKTAKK